MSARLLLTPSLLALALAGVRLAPALPPAAEPLAEAQPPVLERAPLTAVLADPNDPSFEITVTLGPQPSGQLRRGGSSYPLSSVALEQLGEQSQPGSGTYEASYRLRFTYDLCTDEALTSSPWNLCFVLDGWPRPALLQEMTLLLEQHSSISPAMTLHQWFASCVPTSGQGPSCSLQGSELRSGSLHSINGRVVSGS